MRFICALLVLAIISRPLACQTDTSVTPVREGSWPVLVLLVEAVAVGSGVAARSETGARVTGAIQGVSGLTVLGIAALTERRRGAPEAGVIGSALWHNDQRVAIRVAPSGAFAVIRF